jgi:hypothetical protein
MSAASPAKSVPLRPMPMPTSAFRKAGASFTPSPRFFFSAPTMRIFCSARTRANTISVASSASWMSELLAGDHTGVAERTSPISRVIARRDVGDDRP